MIHPRATGVVCVFVLSGATIADAATSYPRAGHEAVLLPGAHQVRGIATILDERTIHVHDFTYDGTAPLVYFYLGATNADSDFENGISIGPVLDQAYDGEGITVQLPAGQTLDGYDAISVWCEAFNVNFSSAPFAAPDYERACHRAVIPPGFHDSQGVATILDERKIQVDHFTYDGTAPEVYFYLGATNSNSDFLSGIPIGPELVRAYDDESITLELPIGQTIDGYGAISVWCVAAKANFSSASFEPPTYARACQRAVIPPGDHETHGVATILDERTIHVAHFDYDGLAPLVYFYLGNRDTYSDFLNGIRIGPLLDREYHDEHITLELPADQSLSGYGAVSVWCEEFKINFSSAPFPRPPADLDIDGDADVDDVAAFDACATGPALGPPAPQCVDIDFDGDNDIDQSDFGEFQECFSGPGILADYDCPR